MTRFKLMISLCALLLPLALRAEVPDLEGYWAPSFGKMDAEGKALVDKLPKDAVLIDDAGGKELGEGDYGGLKLSDKAEKEVANYDFNKELTKEYACTQPSVVLYMQAPFAFELYQSDKFVVMKMEYFDMYRIIFTDGRGHTPPDAPHSKSGNSIGHWDGDELVVDTDHIESGSFMNNGFSHSDNIHLVERFKLSKDGKHLYATQLYDDPEVFTPRGARFLSWHKVEGDYVYPYECDPSYGD